MIPDGTGKVLLTRRSARVREPGKWCLPGGHLEGGETWGYAMGREVREECGLSVLGYRFIGLYSDPALTVTNEVLAEGHFGHFVCAVFLVTDREGEIIPNDEVDAWDWFDLNRLPEPLMKSHRIRIEDGLLAAGGSLSRGGLVR